MSRQYCKVRYDTVKSGLIKLSKLSIVTWKIKIRIINWQGRLDAWCLTVDEDKRDRGVVIVTILKQVELPQIMSQPPDPVLDPVLDPL